MHQINIMKKLFALFILSFLSFMAFSQEDTLHLFYQTNESNLNPHHLEKLEKLPFSSLQKLKIFGFADAPASSQYNRQLSIKRAYRVYFYLINQQVPIQQIDLVKGYGEKQCKNSTKEDSSFRRVDIIYTINKTNPVSNPIQQPKAKEKEISLVEQVKEAKSGDQLIVKDIHFYPGSHFPLPQSEPELQELLHILQTQPKLKIEIQGHICCQYGDTDGFDKDTRTNNLSINRAKEIYQYLINNGISAERLSYKGFGSSKKIYQYERNEMQRIANRRVEILILDK
jgi:outer membrane protein OmpA-like peptidoglycan-associated protein